MLLRVQFAGETFARILRRGFAKQNLCDAQVLEVVASQPQGNDLGPFELLNKPQQTHKGLVFLDHIEISENPPLPFEVGPSRTFALDGTPLEHPALHFAQRVTLGIVTFLDLHSKINMAPDVHTLDVTLVFRLALEMHYAQRALTLTHVQTRDVTVGKSLAKLAARFQVGLESKDVENMLASALAEPIAQPLGFLDELGALELPPVAHMGIAGSVGFGSIEMRFDLREGGQAGIDFAAWQAFHNQTGVDDLRAGRDWALLIDREILVGRGRRMFEQGLEAAEKKNAFRRSGAPMATWNASPPRIDLSCSGKAPDALKCLGQGIDVPVTVKVACGLGIAQRQIGGQTRTVLRADVSASHDADPDAIAALCHGVTHSLELDNLLDRLESLFDGSFVGDFVGWLQGTKPLFPVGVAVVFGPVALLALCVVDVVLFALEGDTSSTLDEALAGCEIPDPSNPDVQVCYLQLSVEPGPGADYGLTLDAASGRSDGLVLAGNVSVGGLARPTIEVVPGTLAWVEPRKTCDGPLHWSANGSILVKQTAGDWPVTVCATFPDTIAFQGLPPSKDYDKFVRRSVLSDKPREVELAISIPAGEIPPAAACFRTHVVTSAGVRLVWIPFPPPLDPQVAQEGEFWAQAWRVAYYETLVDDWTRYFQKYNPRWSIDPPPYEHPYEKRLWVVLGERFWVADRVLAYDGGRRLVEAYADHEGRVSFGVLADGDELVLERQPPLVRGTIGSVLYGHHVEQARSERPARLQPLDEERAADARRPSLAVHQLQLLEYARVPVAVDAAQIEGVLTGRGVRFRVRGRGGESAVEIDRHGVVSLRRRRAGRAADASARLAERSLDASLVVRDARAAMLGLAPAQLEVLRDECRELRSVGGGVELAATYTAGTPWCYRAAQVGDWFAQLDDATATLGLYRVGGRVRFPVRETHRMP